MINALIIYNRIQQKRHDLKPLIFHLRERNRAPGTKNNISLKCEQRITGTNIV